MTGCTRNRRPLRLRSRSTTATPPPHVEGVGKPITIEPVQKVWNRRKEGLVWVSEVWLCPEALAMWTVEQRARYRRDDLRYPSDLSDAEWEVIEPLIPPARPGGRPRTVDLRAVVEGMLYVLQTGCQWRHLPKDFPPRSTVHAYLQQWATDGTLEQIHHALYVRVREQEG